MEEWVALATTLAPRAGAQSGSAAGDKAVLVAFETDPGNVGALISTGCSYGTGVLMSLHG